MDIEIEVESNITITSGDLSPEDLDRITKKHKELKHDLEDFVKKLVEKDSPEDAYERARII